MTEVLEGPEAIALGTELLRLGHCVAFPTETVYGLGAHALDPDAVAKVFALKGRPSTNPMIVHVSGVEMARTLCASWNDAAQQLCEAYWEGPVTIVMERSQLVPDVVTGGGETVALRAPAHPMALALIESCGFPLVGPSANPSGRVSPTRAAHVAMGFQDAELLVIDGGVCRSGIESTVVDLSGGTPTVLRPGAVSAAALSETLAIEVRTLGCNDRPDDVHSAARSPGRHGAHYRPSVPARLVGTQQLQHADARVYIIAHSGSETGGALGVSRIGPDAAGYAAGLYAALHDADASGAAEIWIEQVPEPSADPLWGAVLERLSRACQS